MPQDQPLQFLDRLRREELLSGFDANAGRYVLDDVKFAVHFQRIGHLTFFGGGIGSFSAHFGFLTFPSIHNSEFGS